MSIPDTLYFFDVPAQRNSILAEGSHGIHTVFDSIDAADRAGSSVVKEHVVIAIDMTESAGVKFTKDYPDPMTFVSPIPGCFGYVDGHIPANCLTEVDPVALTP